MDLGQFLAVPEPTTRLALDVPDLCWEGEPIVVRAQPEWEGVVSLKVTVCTTPSEEVVRTAHLNPVGDGAFEAVLAGLPSGTYRVRVMGGEGSGVEPSEDSFAVAARNWV